MEKLRHTRPLLGLRTGDDQYQFYGQWGVKDEGGARKSPCLDPRPVCAEEVGGDRPPRMGCYKDPRRSGIAKKERVTWILSSPSIGSFWPSTSNTCGVSRVLSGLEWWQECCGISNDAKAIDGSITF